MENKHISTEILDFMERTGTTAAVLARESGVNPVYISRLKTGKRKDIRSKYADMLRSAMQRLISEHPHAPQA